MKTIKRKADSVFLTRDWLFINLSKAKGEMGIPVKLTPSQNKALRKML